MSAATPTGDVEAAARAMWDALPASASSWEGASETDRQSWRALAAVALAAALRDAPQPEPITAASSVQPMPSPYRAPQPSCGALTDEDGPECDLCGRTDCPDADLPEFSEPVACALTPAYEALRYDRCEYGCGRDVTKTSVREAVRALAAQPSAPVQTVAEVVRAVEAELDDADQITDSPKRPNRITVWGVRRVLMRFGGRPHRWPVPAEFCTECGHLTTSHQGECNDRDCDCLLSEREAAFGRDEEIDDAITAALWKDAVASGEPWADDDRAALAQDREADRG